MSIIRHAAALLLAVPAMADELDDQAPAMIVTAPRYGESELSSGTRTPTPLVDVPQAASVVTRDLIDDQAMRSIADVLRYVPGASIAQGEGHRDQIVLRGNNSTADFFVDGLRDDVQYFRDLYNVERIEILKGPNAMIFGRGGGGGVVNRVLRAADGTRRLDATAQFGSWEQYRGAVDLGGALGDAAALRFNGLYESSESYRDFFELERYGLNPTGRLSLGDATTLRLGYEYFSDDRTVDRGVPSLAGRPFERDRSQFYGNPDLSYSDFGTHIVTASVEHRFSEAVRVRSALLFGDYDKFYQNVFAAGPVNAAGAVDLAAYNSGTDRQNLISQTDLVATFDTGPVGHQFLVGFEFARQETANRRNEGQFPTNGLRERLTVAAGDPVSFAPVVFGRPSQNNEGTVEIAALYLQEQLEFGPFKVVAGLRYDRFELDFSNALTGQRFARADDLWSPRLGLIWKPAEAASVYASYSRSYLPQSGDQFSTLDLTSAALEPERFENLELGVKWNLAPRLAFSAAVYQLDRDNTRAPGATPGTTVLTGSQRSRGVEVGLVGSITEAWQVIAGLAWQDAEIRRATAAAPAGRDVGLVPRFTGSLWTNYRLSERFGIGAGIEHRAKSFTTISNAVVLPAYTRVDAALFVTLTERLEAQVNVENLFDARYFPTAHNDNNITPGSPRAARVTLAARF